MYKPIIGLEIHVELKTKLKMFCQCKADFFGKEPNTQVCPVCLGLPGALPVPNKKAIEWTIIIAKALNCQVNQITKFDRKHYFYPDLPKGYQISQYDEPIGINGFLRIYKKTDSSQIETKIFRIRRVHLEEDTGKLIHEKDTTLVDFNRSGVPLVEIVTEPDFNDSEDVKLFLEELQTVIKYLKVSDADMEKGSMRLEPNISVIKIKNQKLKIKNNTKRKEKQEEKLPNYKVEIKNINSFRFVKQAIDYELKRQIALLEQGQQPIQETRGFDSKKGITYSQRVKEQAHDYRYFPEPDIPPIRIDEFWLKKIVKIIPELPEERLNRYRQKFNLRYESAFILTRNKDLGDYFEEIIKRVLSKSPQLKIDNLPQLIANLIVNKKVSIDQPLEELEKKILEIILPKKADESLLNDVINKIIKENVKAVEDYKKGKENALMFLVGKVMKEMKGQVEGKILIEKIKNKLLNK